jgi:hypothetical protein
MAYTWTNSLSDNLSHIENEDIEEMRVVLDDINDTPLGYIAHESGFNSTHLDTENSPVDASDDGSNFANETFESLNVDRDDFNDRSDYSGNRTDDSRNGTHDHNG